MADRKLTKFAFWEYDRPPYVVGTETDGKRDKDGMVDVPAYQGRVKPLTLMDAKKGRATLTALQELNAARQKACNDAYRIFKQDALEIAPFMKSVFRK